MSNITININLKNNELIVLSNNYELIKYKFNYNVNKITNAIIYNLSNDNKFK
jgi:hypothetical protein